MTDSSGDRIARRDELLEVLYWIEGEGFQGAASFEALVRFLAREAASVRDTLEQLVQEGQVEFIAARQEYRLSDTGRREGARRFAEEFGSMLNQGHGECNDPNCDCHSDPLAAAECHARHDHPH